MSDPHQAVQQLVSEARRLENASGQYAEAMAGLLVGHMQRVTSALTLKALKKELANYNIHTGRWKK